MITRCPRPTRRFVAPALSAAALLCLSGAAAGSNIDPTAYGHQLAGGLLTVTWVPGPGGASISTSAPIFASGPDAGAAFLPDPFGGPNPGAIFRVAGDTFLGKWSLENLADAFVTVAFFDLAGSISIFDDSPTSPDTPGSAAGQDGVVYDAALSTAPAEIFADEFVLWGGQKNAGDLWVQERINWAPPTVAGGGFAPGQLYVWNDDTDVIPAPGAWALLGAAGLLASRRRR